MAENIDTEKKICTTATEKQQKQHLTQREQGFQEVWLFSEETREVRKKWNKIYKVGREKNCQPTLLCPAINMLISKGEMTFSEEWKLRIHL